MHAQSDARHNPAHQVETARLLLLANETYGRSNRSDTAYAQRVAARIECREQLQSLLLRAPENAKAQGLMGRVEMDDGNLQKARTLFDTSLRLQPSQAQQYVNLGYWALNVERPAQAEQYFSQALQHERQSASAFSGIAHAKRFQNQFDVAYLHYRTLIRSGHANTRVYSAMLECASHLSVHNADPLLRADAITLLNQSHLAHQKIGRFVCEILRQHYSPDTPGTMDELAVAASDELLLLALNRIILPDPVVESLITSLRRRLVQHIARNGELEDGLQQLALGLGRYAERTGYALATQDNEQQLTATININLRVQLSQGDGPETVAGSVIISALYGALFHQDFAAALGHWNLVDWPLAMQPLMAASYYDRAWEEDVKQKFAEKAKELHLNRDDTPQAWPAWTELNNNTETSLRALMANELGLSVESLPATLRLMVCGCQSGQRALELARYLSDVEVIAVDESLANVARGSAMAEATNIDNIVFWPWSLAQRFIADGHQVHWVEIGRLPSPAMVDLSLANLVNQIAAAGTIVHLHTDMAEQTRGDEQIRRLISEYDLEPRRNTLQQLRRMVLNNRADDVWQSLLQDENFYSLGGCHDRWFRPQSEQQLKSVLAMVSNEVQWKLIKARDEDGHSLATGPVQQQIREEALGSHVQSLLGQKLSVYFQRRR
jgi:Tfp pilus assembly protein PilF